MGVEKGFFKGRKGFEPEVVETSCFIGFGWIDLDWVGVEMDSTQGRGEAKRRFWAEMASGGRKWLD